MVEVGEVIEIVEVEEDKVGGVVSMAESYGAGSAHRSEDWLSGAVVVGVVVVLSIGESKRGASDCHRACGS